MRRPDSRRSPGQLYRECEREPDRARGEDTFAYDQANRLTSATVSGNVIETYQSDEFGIPMQTQGGVSQPFQFTGQQRDASTGLYDLWARMYDPPIGRFLSSDTLAGVAAAPPTLNRFAYAGNNPVSSVDPSGLKSQAALPGPCLYQTIFGGFIFSSAFCSPFQATGKQQTQQDNGCPDSADSIVVGIAGGMSFSTEIPSTDNNRAACHVNVEMPGLGKPKQSFIDWHIYFTQGVFSAVDTGTWRAGGPPYKNQSG